MSIVERGARPVRRQLKRLIHKSRDVDEVRSNEPPVVYSLNITEKRFPELHFYTLQPPMVGNPISS